MSADVEMQNSFGETSFVFLTSIKMKVKIVLTSRSILDNPTADLDNGSYPAMLGI